MRLSIRECITDDIYTLREFASQTFNDAFAHLNTPANMQAYLKQAFDIDRLRSELSNSSSRFYFLYSDEDLSGYLKLNEYKAQTDINDPESLEIERIYVARKFQGSGLGGVLISKAVEVANARKKAYLWLGVWQKNAGAISFYKKNGFFEAGKHSFFMGEEEQTDFILRRDLL